MNPRRWSTVILFVASAAAVGAFSLQFDPCLTAVAVALVGLTVLIVVVIRNARAKLAASRVHLMRLAQMCPACGYTIRVDTDRCPECGTEIEAPA